MRRILHGVICLPIVLPLVFATAVDAEDWRGVQMGAMQVHVPPQFAPHGDLSAQEVQFRAPDGSMLQLVWRVPSEAYLAHPEIRARDRISFDGQDVTLLRTQEGTAAVIWAVFPPGAPDRESLLLVLSGQNPDQLDAQMRAILAAMSDAASGTAPPQPSSASVPATSPVRIAGGLDPLPQIGKLGDAVFDLIEGWEFESMPGYVLLHDPERRLTLELSAPPADLAATAVLDFGDLRGRSFTEYADPYAPQNTRLMLFHPGADGTESLLLRFTAEEPPVDDWIILRDFFLLGLDFLPPGDPEFALPGSATGR
ncbi:MAG: hypothetical protein EA407_02835 [Rhodobacteraceae bacterium]|nr:MAG: hypothetical protein EA407_02835 [Paracoccaceae bacterium]